MTTPPTPTPEQVAEKLVSDWLESHWPVDDPTPKEPCELDLVKRIATALAAASRVREGMDDLLAACKRYIDVDGADRTWEERRPNYNSIYLCVRNIDAAQQALDAGRGT